MAYVVDTFIYILVPGTVPTFQEQIGKVKSYIRGQAMEIVFSGMNYWDRKMCIKQLYADVATFGAGIVKVSFNGGRYFLVRI